MMRGNGVFRSYGSVRAWGKGVTRHFRQNPVFGVVKGDYVQHNEIIGLASVDRSRTRREFPKTAQVSYTHSTELSGRDTRAATRRHSVSLPKRCPAAIEPS